MTTKERIYQEIENARPEDLDELYQLICDFFAARREAPKEETVMSKLRKIKFYGPEDFAENLDLYLSGEKTFVVQKDTD